MSWPAALLLTAVPIPSPTAGDARWQWPLRPPPPVVRGFDPPARPWEAGHRGVDLAVPPGRPVFAAGAGRVGFARDLAGRGVVTIIHGALRTTYMPVRPTVRAGRLVAAGARIGVIDGTLGHCGQVSCLHWGLLRGDSYLDPLALLGLGPVRLMPWWRAPSGSVAVVGQGTRRSPPAGRSPRPAAAAPATRPVADTTGIGAGPVAGPIAVAGAAVLAFAGRIGRRRRDPRPGRGGVKPADGPAGTPP